MISPALLGSDPSRAVSPWAAVPFGLLLLAIALGPLVAKDWWHRHYPKVALSLGALVAGFTLFAESGLGTHALLHAGVEYVSFVALIGSLFVISGGIVVRLRAAPSTLTNVALLALGGIVANLVGTTGAAMLLIRPYLRLNQARIGAHHVVFFIFIVANCGGALTPIGDPPLFLGYLRGVPFFWTVQALVAPWSLMLALLLATFAVVDGIAARRHAPAPAAPGGFTLKISGANHFFFLAGVLALVLVQGHPFLKDHEPVSSVVVAMLMLILGAISYRASSPEARQENEFTFEPIREVAILFAGIFATMIPALEYVAQNADVFGLNSPRALYFATGALSGVLDNAPTYLTFLTTELGHAGLNADDPAHVHEYATSAAGWSPIAAISAGAVFFGAATYIGNGPNFMVKSIAEAAGAPCPSFFGFIGRWSIPFLLPFLLLVAFVFFGA